MSKTWFVTGAAGFIGSNLCKRLLERGHKVTGLDNFATGKRGNIQRLLDHSDFTFFEGDIRDHAAVNAAAEGADVIIHLAAQVMVQESIRDFVYNDSVNVGGFLTVAAVAKERAVDTFIYVSSCAVYGDNPALPLAETEQPSPLSPYAVSKLTNEAYASVISPTMTATRMVGLRLFNIFGPWQDFDSGYAAVIPKWISMLSAGTQPVIFGDGSATRDFCFVGDVCDLMMRVADMPGKQAHDVFNIGTGTATSLLGLFNTIVAEMSKAGAKPAFETPRFEAWRMGDIVHSVADSGKARRDLGFDPKVSVAEGVRLLLAEQYAL